MTEGAEQREDGVSSHLSRLALASVLLGIPSYLLLGPITAIPGVICGHMALSRIRKAAGTLRGRGIAIAGLVVGYVALFIYLVVLPALLVPAALTARRHAQQAKCWSNAKAITEAYWAYVDETKEFPWEMEQLHPYLEAAGHDLQSVLVCPSATNRVDPSYELVFQWAPAAFGKPTHNVMLREKDWNHGNERTIAYFDGIVESELRKEPEDGGDNGP